MKNKNTILAVLITLGIVAVGISAYIKYAMPYLQEITLEKVDGERIQDLDTLNESLKEMEISVATSTVYVSLPSDDSACKTISDLPSLPDGWTYHCASETDYKNSNGTGWIPLNLSEKTGPELAVDPVNKAETLSYYSFVAEPNGQTSYAIAGILDSKKYIREKAQNDGGTDVIRYEKGNNLSLWARAQGLIGYYSFDEPTISIVDESGNANNGTIKNPIKKEKCIQKSCLQLSGTGQSVTFSNIEGLNSNKMTMTLWANLEKTEEEAYELIWNPLSVFSLYAYNTQPKLRTVSSVTLSDIQYFTEKSSLQEYDAWNQLGFSFSNGVLANISNGKKTDETRLSEPSLQISKNEIILNNRDLYRGSLDEFRVYNRDLSSVEIKRSYDALQTNHRK